MAYECSNSSPPLSMAMQQLQESFPPSIGAETAGGGGGDKGRRMVSVEASLGSAQDMVSMILVCLAGCGDFPIPFYIFGMFAHLKEIVQLGSSLCTIIIFPNPGYVIEKKTAACFL